MAQLIHKWGIGQGALGEGNKKQKTGLGRYWGRGGRRVFERQKKKKGPGNFSKLTQGGGRGPQFFGGGRGGGGKPKALPRFPCRTGIKRGGGFCGGFGFRGETAKFSGGKKGYAGKKKYPPPSATFPGGSSEGGGTRHFWGGTAFFPGAVRGGLVFAGGSIWRNGGNNVMEKTKRVFSGGI